MSRDPNQPLKLIGTIMQPRPRFHSRSAGQSKQQGENGSSRNPSGIERSAIAKKPAGKRRSRIWRTPEHRADSFPSTHSTGGQPYLDDAGECVTFKNKPITALVVGLGIDFVCRFALICCELTFVPGRGCGEKWRCCDPNCRS